MYKLNDGVIITIGRTYGSGGREIGKMTAKELGIPFYDKELLEVEAKEGRVCKEYLNAFDEKRPGSLMYSMTINPYGRYIKDEPLDLLVQNIQYKAIKDVAAKGSCVIIGRRADQILRGKFDVCSVFITASIEKRIARVSERDKLSEHDSKKQIHKADKQRRLFYNYYGEGNWGEAGNYNLCLDSGDLGVANSVAMIMQYLLVTGKASL